MNANAIFNKIIEIETEIISRISTDKDYITSKSYDLKNKEIKKLEDISKRKNI